MKSKIVQLQIGKNGLTQEFIEQVRNIMESKRAVKISFLKSSTRNREEAKTQAEEITKALGENYRYDMIGWTIIVKKGKKKV